MKSADVKDYPVKIVIPGDGIELNLYKRGVELLEATVDEYGTSALTRLVCIAPRLFKKCGNGSLSWKEAMEGDDEARAIFDLYSSAYEW